MTTLLHQDAGMTRNQFLIWLGQEAAPDKPIFNEMSVFVIPGDLDVPRFRQAFQNMLDEVDALRTRVKRVDGYPKAEVCGHLSYESGFIDLSGEEDPDHSLRNWARLHVDSAIDLAVRPFDSTLIKLAPDRYAWALLCHQLLTDATSMSLIFDRVSNWYLRLSGSDVPPLPAAPTFLEYVERESQDSKTARHSAKEAYWTAKVADPTEPMVYYEGRSASPSPGTRRYRVERSLGRELTEAIRHLARLEEVRSLSEHLSSYSVFCAALLTYLNKLSGHERIAIGTTWHNRPRQFRSTVGLLMVQNPLEVQIDPSDTYLTLIKKVQAEAFSSMRHLPYAAGNPGGRIYDVTLNYVKVTLGRFAGWPVEHHWYRPSVGDGSIQMQVHDVAGQENVTVSLDLSADVFTPADRDSVAAHYLACLESLIEDPNQTIRSASILTEAEKLQLTRWNCTQREYPSDATVVDLFVDQAERRPSAIAVSCGGRQMSYEQLRKHASHLALRLRDVGVGPEVPVGIFLNRSTDLLVSLLGVLESGGAYVPLDPAFPPDRLKYMIDDSGAQILITEKCLADQIDFGDRYTLYIDDPESVAETRVTSIGTDSRANPDNLAYVLYTSGSTGRPKGVEVPHRALTNFLCAMAEEPGCTETDKLLAVTTLSFDIAGLELFLPLITGGRVEIVSRDIALDARRLRTQLDNSGITILQATPATWRMLLDAGWTGTPGLKALIGGEALPPDLVRPLLDRTSSLWNMYGPTETTVWSSVQRISSPMAEITVGRPIANTGFYIMDSQLQQLPVGVAGELLISGDGLARGYRNRSDLTADRFVQISPSGTGAPAQRMYRTGDLARFNADGQIVHLGRLDQQVKIRGFRIELGEIEAVLTVHESIQQAVVVAHEANSAGARLIAYFIPTERDASTSADLRQHLLKLLPDYMVPQQFIEMGAMPLTPNGKIDRRMLPKPEPMAAAAATAEVSTQSPLEAQVARAFCEVLGLRSIGPDADFFDMGGQSILALRLVSKLSEDLGIEIPLQTLFEASTVIKLSQRLSLMTSTTPELRTVSLGGPDLENRLRRVWLSAVGVEPPRGTGSGNSLTDAQVAELLAQVRHEFGVAAEGLSALAFRSDPTVDGLARALHDALNPPPALVVPLQPRGTKTPLFLVHAGGGYVFFYRALAARLAPDQPVYAIRAATRRDSQQHRFDRTGSIEELATRYIGEIRRVQPKGPYNLGGACLGGVVAFEMAQQLLARGESIGAPILLFDSFVGKVEEDWGDYTSRALSSVAERLSADGITGRSDLVRVLLSSTFKRPLEVIKLAPLAARSLFRRGRTLFRGAQLPRQLHNTWLRDQTRSMEQEQLDTMRVFLETSLQLVSRYEPKAFPGPAVLVKAAIGVDPEPLWTPWVTGGLKVQVAPGEHLDMMEEPWVKETAEFVRQVLEE